MANIFKLAAGIVNLYSLICFARIIITWFPNVAFSSVGKFLAAVCDPFLNLFRKIKWLQISLIDFSPLVALAVLTAISSVLENIANTGYVSLGGILALIISIAWSTVSSLINFFVIILVIRFLVMVFSKNSNYYGSVWSKLDSVLSPMIFRLTSFFTGGKSPSYKSSLLTAIILLLVISFVGRFAIGYLIVLMGRIPI